MEDGDTTHEEYTQALQRIISDKTYDPHSNPLPWPTLRRRLVHHVFQILETQFTVPLSTRATHPLNKTAESLADTARRLGAHLESQFPTSPPFTILRVAELMVEPVRYCRESEPVKFLAALETLVYVQSTVDEFENVKLEKEGGESGTREGLDSLADSSGAKKVYNDKNSSSSGDLGNLQTIQMEPISWITEEQLREIEEDANRTS